MKYKSLVSFAYCLLFCSFGTFANNIVIRYIVNRDSLSNQTLSLSSCCLDLISNNYDNFDIKSKECLPASKKVIYSGIDKEIIIANYFVKYAKTYFLTDLFGHEILLNDKVEDTLTFTLNPIRLRKSYAPGRKASYLNDSVKAFVYFKIQYPKKYNYIGFFDQIAELHGDLRAGGGGYSFKEMNHDLLPYIKKVNQIYKDRLEFYNRFVEANAFPDKLKYYALKEIQYSYYLDLMSPIVEYNANLINDYPESALDSLNFIGKDLNNQDLFNNTSTYRTVVVDYVCFAKKIGKLISKQDELQVDYFNSRLPYIKTYLKSNTQGYSLAYLMFFAGRMNNLKMINKIYRSYNHQTSNRGTNLYIDSLKRIYLSNGSITAKELSGILFENEQGQKVNLHSVLGKKITVIDCWATWCIPCREQLPALKSIIEQYSQNVQFIFLSADQSYSRWKDWLAKSNHPQNQLQLHAPGGFENLLFRKLLINSIPRYLLISSKGELINSSMPYPTQVAEFKKELDRHL